MSAVPPQDEPRRKKKKRQQQLQQQLQADAAAAVDSGSSVGPGPQITPIDSDGARGCYRIDVNSCKSSSDPITVVIIPEPLSSAADETATDDGLPDPVVVLCGCCRIACLIGCVSVTEYRMLGCNKDEPKWHPVYSTENVSWLTMQLEFGDPAAVEVPNCEGEDEDSLPSIVRRLIATELPSLATGGSSGRRRLCAFACQSLAPEPAFIGAFAKHNIFRYVLSAPKSPPRCLHRLTQSPTHAAYLASAQTLSGISDQEFRVHLPEPGVWQRLHPLLEGGSNPGPPHRMVVCGPRNVGKSSLARCLVNRLLPLSGGAGVAFLDCDVGQTEFTPPGIVSLTLVRAPLLGPPFTHQAFAAAPAAECDDEDNADDGDDDEEEMLMPRILTARCLGGSSPSNPRDYLSAVAQLAAESADLQVPLVINTMGWTNGLGLLYLCETLRLVRPTCVVQIESDMPARNLPAMLTPQYLQGDSAPRFNSDWADELRQHLSPHQQSHSLICVPGRLRSQPCRYGAPQQRELSVLATILPLANCPVYRVPFGFVRVFVAAAAASGGQDCRQLDRVLNASLVGLCTSSSSSVVDDQEKFRDDRQQRLLSVPHLPPSSRCLGVGLVRCVDTARRELCVQTWLTPAQLPDVRLLVHGLPDLPLAFLARLAAPSSGAAAEAAEAALPPYVGELADCGIGSLRLRTERRPLKHRHLQRGQRR